MAAPAADVGNLVDSVRKLEDNPELAHAMGERGRAYAAGFDRRRLLEQFEEILLSVAKQRRA